MNCWLPVLARCTRRKFWPCLNSLRSNIAMLIAPPDDDTTASHPVTTWSKWQSIACSIAKPPAPWSSTRIARCRLWNSQWCSITLERALPDALSTTAAVVWPCMSQSSMRAMNASMMPPCVVSTSNATWPLVMCTPATSQRCVRSVNTLPNAPPSTTTRVAVWPWPITIECTCTNEPDWPVIGVSDPSSVIIGVTIGSISISSTKEPRPVTFAASAGDSCATVSEPLARRIASSSDNIASPTAPCDALSVTWATSPPVGPDCGMDAARNEAVASVRNIVRRNRRGG